MLHGLKPGLLLISACGASDAFSTRLALHLWVPTRLSLTSIWFKTPPLLQLATVRTSYNYRATRLGTQDKYSSPIARTAA